MFVKLCFICLLFLGGLCSLSRSCTSSSTRASFPSVAPAGLERDVTDSIYYKDVLPRLYLHLNNKIQFELSVERAKRNFEKPQKVRSHPRPRDDDDDNERKDDREMMRCASPFSHCLAHQPLTALLADTHHFIQDGLDWMMMAIMIIHENYHLMIILYGLAICCQSYRPAIGGICLERRHLL